jgi:hypothetical protein
MADADSVFRKKVLEGRNRFQPDQAAAAKKAAIDLAAKNRLNSDRESQTGKDISQTKLLAEALEEKLKLNAENAFLLKESILADAKNALKTAQDNFKIDQELVKVDLKSNLLKTQTALNKHYPTGIPQSIVDELAVLYSDVIKDPDQSPLWLTFVKDNNESIAHFTKVEALRVKRLIDAAYDSVAKIESHIKAINADMKAQLAIGYDPETPLKLHGEPQDPRVIEQARKTYDSLGGQIRVEIKAASLLIKEFSAKIKPPISIESAALFNPFNELSKVVDGLKRKDGNTPSSDFYTDAKSIVTGMESVFKKINDDVNSLKIRGVDNPIFGANSWYEFTDKTDTKKRIYFNQKTGDTLWKSPNVISLDPNQDIPTVAIEPLVFNKILERFPPFSSSEGVPPMIYTGKRDILADQPIIVDNDFVILAREHLSPASDEKQKHLADVAKLEQNVQENTRELEQRSYNLKINPPKTAASALGSQEFLSAIQSLQTPVNGVIPESNAKLLKEIVTKLMDDPYGAELSENREAVNALISNFNKFKIENKNLPEKIAEEAKNVNKEIELRINTIQSLYENLPENVVRDVKERILKLKPLSQVAPQSGTSNTATTASNDTPASFSMDTDATPTASKVAMPSVSAFTSSSATPTSVSTESTPMQGASEGKGETNHSIDEKTGEKIQHPSWENIFKINDASKSVASSASNGVADTASVDSAPIPLEADAAIAEANASTEVPTPLKSIPASNLASAIKVQEDMDNEAETTDNSTTNGSKKSKIVAPTTSNSISK